MKKKIKMKEYNFKKIESKWQKDWDKKGIYKTKDVEKGKKNFYHLVMFPYPSGNLHIGHWYNFAPADVFARYKRMQGFNVLAPIGFDSFGLPAENAAIKRNIHPKVWTYKNIETMTKQLKTMGNVYDWSRKVVTSDPEYYKWTQWIFLQLYKNGLAYKHKAPANWCPKCHTVLANEQVVNGGCERCGTEVVQREIDQWLFKITKYANDLIGDLDGLDWPEKTKTMQKNWIGKSTGTIIKFGVNCQNQSILCSPLEVFTTRIDTIFGCTYVVVAPEHELLTKMKNQITNIDEVEKYVNDAKKKSDLQRAELEKNKTGVELEGIKVVNPFNKEEVPVFVADYVLGHYGTGAVMAVPAHDERDFEFAKKYGLEIRHVVMPSRMDKSNPPQEGKENTFRNTILAILYDPKTKKYLTLKWKKQPWRTFVTGGVEDGESRAKAAQREIEEETGYTNIRLIRSLGRTEAFFFAAHKNVNRRTHGEHFLFELVDDTKIDVAEEEKNQYDLEWLSQEELGKANMQHSEFDVIWNRIVTGNDIYVDDGVLSDSDDFTGLSSEEARIRMGDWLEKNKHGKRTIKYKLRDWLVSRQRYWGAPIPMIYCKKCGAVPVPENKLPVILPKVKKYLPTEEGLSPLAHSKEFLNTKCPKCKGPATRETDTMDTFVCSSWYYLRYADNKNKKVFADAKKIKSWLPVQMYIGGAEHTVLHLLYSRFFTKALKDFGYLKFSEPFSALRHQGMIQGPDGQKMSKSRGNVVDPDELVRNFGADAVRLYLCFMGDYSQGGPWNPTGIMGVKRFLDRVWRLQYKVSFKKGLKDSEIDGLLHKTIKKVTEDIVDFKFNTAVSSMMILLSEMETQEQISAQSYSLFVKLLAPFCPHITDELWAILGSKKSIHLDAWPKYNPDKIKDESFNLVVQVNGKFRGTIKMKTGTSQNEAQKTALTDEKIKLAINGKEIKKVIFVPNKLINLVI